MRLFSLKMNFGQFSADSDDVRLYRDSRSPAQPPQMRTVIVSIASPRQAAPAVNAVILAAIGHTCSFMSALNAFASRTTPIPATPANRDSQIFVNDHAVDLKPPELRQSRSTYEFPTGSNVLRGVVDTHLSEADKDLLENAFHRSQNVRPPMVLVAA